jgi:hypothetical protein
VDPRRTVSEEEVRRVRALEGVTVHDVSAKMISVEADPAVLERFVAEHPEWRFFPEVIYSLPETPRQRLLVAREVDGEPTSQDRERS